MSPRASIWESCISATLLILRPSLRNGSAPGLEAIGRVIDLLIQYNEELTPDERSQMKTTIRNMVTDYDRVQTYSGPKRLLKSRNFNYAASRYHKSMIEMSTAARSRAVKYRLAELQRTEGAAPQMMNTTNSSNVGAQQVRCSTNATGKLSLTAECRPGVGMSICITQAVDDCADHSIQLHFDPALNTPSIRSRTPTRRMEDTDSESIQSTRSSSEPRREVPSPSPSSGRARTPSICEPADFADVKSRKETLKEIIDLIEALSRISEDNQAVLAEVLNRATALMRQEEGSDF